MIPTKGILCVSFQRLVLQALPCYNFIAIRVCELGRAIRALRVPVHTNTARSLFQLVPSNTFPSRDVMGCKYNNSNMVHRIMLIRDYSSFRFHVGGCSPRSKPRQLFKGSLRVTPLLPAVTGTV